MKTIVKCSDEEIDDAAVWIARLRAPDRTSNVEKGFRRWLAEKQSHAAAFETVSTAWEASGALKCRPLPKLNRWERAGFRAGFWGSTAVVAAAAALVIIGAMFVLRYQGIATGVGEQRVLALEDGSKIVLNTATRVVVHYTDHERRVDLKNGEALFEVAKQANRPFVVNARDRRITALGTSFLVRDDDKGLSVTLVEGKVAVSNEKVMLAPGQRLMLSELPRLATVDKVDRPPLEKVLAWRRGQIELDDLPLTDAVAEVNRYSTLKVVVENPDAGKISVNGVFRAGDAEGFALAVASSYGMNVERKSNEFILLGRR